MDFEQQLQERGICVVNLTPKLLEVRNHPHKYTVILFCTGGEATIEVNMESFRITPHTRVCYTHVMLMRLLKVTPDFQATSVVISDTFAFDSAIGLETEMLQSLFNTSVRRVESEQRWELLHHLAESLRIYGEMDAGKYHREIARSILRSMVIILGEEESQLPRSTTGYSMSDTYFRNFINLINDNVTQNHEVAYYAERLHITSKYLNEICKLKSGHKAKEIISSILTIFIQRELIYSSKSMKELAAEFHFADQSSLGKFFRKQTGLSPLAFKNSQS